MKIPVATALATLAVAAFPAHAAAAPATITMSGSSVAGAVLQDLAYFFRHAVPHPPQFSFVGGASGGGIADAARGIVDGGMVSRNIGQTDPPGLVLTPFALSGVCLVTNVANPIPDMSRATIQDLVSGRDTSWSQVPGSKRTDPIVSVAYDLSGGARQVFNSVFVDVATQILYSPRIFVTGGQIRDFIEQTPASWGYVDLALVRSLHVMTYQGIPCNRTTIRTGTYPGQRPLGVVTRGAPKGAIKRFLHWVTTSRKAQQVIATRYITLNNLKIGQPAGQ